MGKNHNSLQSDRRIKTLRDTSLTCGTYKIRSLKSRLCFRCGDEFLSNRPYKHICEECSLIIDEIAFARSFGKLEGERK
ncbi:MAG: hypothetical protein ACYSTS_19185 [Planctomycetota bacterium]|jgi:hypothetical protein